MSFEDDVLELMELTTQVAQRRARNYEAREYAELIDWSEFLLDQSKKEAVRIAIRDAYKQLALETSFLDEQTLRARGIGLENNRGRLSFLLEDQETGAGIVSQGIHREVNAVRVRISSFLEQPPVPPRNYLQSSLQNVKTVFGSLRDIFGDDPKVKALFALWEEFAGIFAA